ncbi:MAG: CotH kinase family protein [Emergencia sp.]
MSGSKYFNRVAVIVTVLMLVLTVLFMNGNALGIKTSTHIMGYEERLFDNTKVHTIDIVMDDWDDLIANATSEEYYAADVVIDNESYKNVGLRAKGNTSLSTVAALGSERYSFKIEFDCYDSTGTYYGLDKLSLNNLIQDSTMMKDYLTYTMMNEFGVNSPLCSFVYITVNGEDWGLYLAVEGVEEAFLERNYGSDYGELYKPDSMSFGGGRGNGKDFNMEDFDLSEMPENSDQSNMPENFEPPERPENSDSPEKPENSDSPGMPENFEPPEKLGENSEQTGGEKQSNFGKQSGTGSGGFDGDVGGGGMGSSDVKLQYIDDKTDSYSNIWDNAKTEITTADKKRLIKSLKKLSGNDDIESVVDIEQVIRYFVVHNFVCNGDSYTGSMIHNYYLYEKNGQMAMIPWDYNLAYGTFDGGDATGTVNTPIDSPVSGDSSDRPMLNWIFESEEYTELYHQYFAEFLNSTDIQGIIDDAYDLIETYVKEDPTAFYTYEEFEQGVETLRQFCSLRSESISQQLEKGETTENMSYVDASSITLSDMGSMNNGKGGFGGGPGRTENTEEADSSTSAENFNAPESPESSESPENSESFESKGGDSAGGENGTAGGPPGDFDSSKPPEDFDESNVPDGATQPSAGSMQPPAGSVQQPDGSAQPSAGSVQQPDGNRQSPDGTIQSPGANGAGATQTGAAGWIWIAVSVLILGIGLIVVKLYYRAK